MRTADAISHKIEIVSLSLTQIESTVVAAQLPAADVTGLYVHVPFCFHKCHYCDFYSITRQPAERMALFVDLILREAEHWTAESAKPRVRPKTVFFGGGTPTLLPVDQMRRLIQSLREPFDLDSCEEFTVEANPATVTREYAEMLRQSGVDRLSFGAQSFNLAELKILEREHDPKDVGLSVEIARDAGFERLNVDLIFAIPGQSLDSWMRSLESAIRLRTPHISCYNLTYEPNTPMAVRRRLGHFKPIEDDAEVAMLYATRRRLADAGLSAYEISNFAAPGEACLHNLNYWTGGNYIGLGPSAASHVEGWRWKNRPHLGEWERAIQSGNLPAAEVEQLSLSQRLGELAMLMLRLAGGLNFDDYTARTGNDARHLFSDVIDRYTRTGLLKLDPNAVRLSESGIRVADAVAAEFLQVSR